jgi:hypothetical protein
MNRSEDKGRVDDPLGEFLRANAPQPPGAGPELLQQLEWRIRGNSRFGSRIKQWAALALAASVAIAILVPEQESVTLVSTGSTLESDASEELFDEDLTLTLQIGSDYLRLVNSEDD